MSIDQLFNIVAHGHFRLAVAVTRYNRMASADTVIAMKGMAADPLKRKLLLKVHFHIICVLHLSCLLQSVHHYKH